MISTAGLTKRGHHQTPQPLHTQMHINRSKTTGEMLQARQSRTTHTECPKQKFDLYDLLLAEVQNRGDDKQGYHKLSSTSLQKPGIDDLLQRQMFDSETVLTTHPLSLPSLLLCLRS
jgi:hypothetical protein